MIKKIASVCLILAILMVLFFTLQEPTRSRELSEVVRMWLGNIGINVEYKELRSNIHILEYFIVGLTMCGFCKSRGLKVWMAVAISCGIGVLDEGIKLLLPGREFDMGDLIRDWIGIGIAVVITMTITKIRKLCFNRE